jgi:Transcription elongation factor, GreA/GreB, C-term
MSDNKRAQVGQNCHVEVELVDEQDSREQMAFDLVADKAADFDNGRIGINTPLAKAIRGKFAGNEVEYVKGDIRKVRIVNVTPLETKVSDDASARRQAMMEEALRKAERTDTEMFAASYDGKWGDYNTDGMSGTENEL